MCMWGTCVLHRDEQGAQYWRVDLAAFVLVHLEIDDYVIVAEGGWARLGWVGGWEESGGGIAEGGRRNSLCGRRH